MEQCGQWAESRQIVETRLRRARIQRNSPLRLTLWRFWRNSPAMIGLVGLAILTLVVTIGPAVIDRDLAMRPQPLQILQPPSPTHLLGTDEVGRDILARLVFAGQVSMGISFPATLLSPASISAMAT